MSLIDLFRKQDEPGKEPEKEAKKEKEKELKEEKRENSGREVSVTESFEDIEALAAKTAEISWMDTLDKMSDSRMYELHNEFLEGEGMEPMNLHDFIDYVLQDSDTDGIFLPSSEKKYFLTNCMLDINNTINKNIAQNEADWEISCEKAVEKMKAEAEKRNADPEPLIKLALSNMENPYENMDAHAYVFIPVDNMVAYIYVCPPKGHGMPISEEIITEAITDAGVKIDFDTEKVHSIVENKMYSTFILIAKGRKPVNGVDGDIEIFYDKTDGINLEENKYGQVDYKNLGKFFPIKKDDVICKITKAVPGEDGVDVKGKVLRAYNGKEALVPKGQGTYMSEDGLTMMADTDGYITYSNGVFNVKQKMIVKGNVDASTGNIVFNGDLEVQGDVSAGYTIDVTGDIKVFGVVESATLKAGGNISIKHGVNGNNQATLEAGGDIKSLFFENCSVRAQGVFSESIIQSNIYSDTVVDCMRGKGVIIGGTINAQERVEANVIGSKIGKLTTINLGESFISAARLDELSKSIDNDKKLFERIVKNIEFLDKMPNLPDDKKELYRRLKEQQSAYAMKLKKNIDEFSILKNKKTDYSACRVKAGTLYSPLVINIGSESLTIHHSGTACCYRYDSQSGKIVTTAY